MKEVTIREISNGFIVVFRDPQVEAQRAAMNYSGVTLSYEHHCTNVEELSLYLKLIFAPRVPPKPF